MFPSLFISHGSPMVAVETSEYALFLENLAATFPRPSAIVIFSAHWESEVQLISDMNQHTMMYDFGGFPDELYHIQYPAKGNQELSREIQQMLTQHKIPSRLETQRGLDHGVWTILRRIYPQADIPVIAMSVNPNLWPVDQYQIGKVLSPLREKDILIIGSGVTVHNFQLFHVQDKEAVTNVVSEFENWLENQLHTGNVSSLLDYESKAPYAKIAVPPHAKEHFAPIFYALGSADHHPHAKTLHRSLLLGVMTNSVYQFGS